MSGYQWFTAYVDRFLNSNGERVEQSSIT